MPFLLFILLATILTVKKMLSYKNPMFQSVATVKIDRNTYGFSAANLFKDFDVFSTNEDIKAEVELIQSQVIIDRALDYMDFDVCYYRVGEIRTSDIYHETPFIVKYDSADKRLVDKKVDVFINNREKYILEFSDKLGRHRYEGKFNEWLQNDSVKIKLVPNPPKFNKPDNVLFDHYQFRINSRTALEKLVKSNLKVKETEEYVPVILIIYRDESALRSANMVNALAEAYIDDYIDRKSYVSEKSLEFIRKRIKEAGKELEEAERKLKEFKKKYKVVNTYQETETGLREISKIKLQLDNLLIQKATLDTLNKYINEKGIDFDHYAPKNAFGDLLYTELMKKLKLYQSEKEDLLLTYTPESEKVKAVDRKINDIVKYIKESIKSTQQDIEIQKHYLDSIYEKSTKMFDRLPEREKEYVVLNRNFQIVQDIYVFLRKKEIEAATQLNAKISFHRVISHAHVPDEPVTPNKTLILFVSGLLSIIVGILLIYLKDFLFSVVKERSQIEKQTTIPVAALVPKITKGKYGPVRQEVFNSLANTLTVKEIVSNKGLVVVTSTIKKEGKSFVARHLAESYARKGVSTVLMDFNLRKPEIHKVFNVGEVNGVADFIMGRSTLSDVALQTKRSNLYIITAGHLNELPSEIFGNPNFEHKINAVREQFDLVIVDTPATANAIDAIKLMKLATANLYLFRANYTRTLYLMNPDFIKEEFGIDNMYILLNGITKSINYTGLYVGSRYNYDEIPSDLISFVKRYKESYF